MIDLDASARHALTAADEPQTPVEHLTPAAARQQYLDGFAAVQKPLDDVAHCEERSVGGLRLKIWRGHGAPAAGAPALLYLHGGGWVIGAPETHEDICRILANAVGAVVVSSDYRLAPEHRFPAAIEDCATALAFMVEHAGDLGIDAGRIVVGGDSAGGNLAAVLALMARNGTVPPVVGQILIYPVTDQSQTGESYTTCAEGYGLTAAGMRWFRDHYLTSRAEWDDWRASPLKAEGLAGVAPAIVILAGADVLYSEGLAYARRLEAEARCTTKIWPGQIHGFVSHGGIIPEAAEALAAIVEAWRGMDARLSAPQAT
ncbi:acetyl esterase [Rhizobium sp. RU20A]|uniref:alpha/beta hydrolase n=1 Tax=Rhizobium sp. RU20A TaxID=1907412 RepID=UPI0009546267|nr:alpha/beta hydrolase [Rhizobium sp. RU20A]SIR45180.1 acetyl esterase [Rhizobium sp. RU20A]